MNTKHYVLAGAAALSLLALSSCFNDDYDLSDIDTTARLQTKNLVVPITLDALTLDQVMDLDDDSEIKDTVVNGKRLYAVKKEGTFDSDPIEVKAFTIAKPSIDPTTKTLAFNPPAPGSLPSLLGFYIIVDVDPTSFNTSANDIDDAIKDIYNLGVTSKITTTLKVSTSGGSAIDWSQTKMTGLKIKMPKGLIVDKPEKGVFEQSTPTQHPDYSLLDLSGETDLYLAADGTISISMDVTAIDVPNSNIIFNANNHSVTMADQIEISEGQVEVYGTPGTTILPASVTFSLNPSMDAIAVNTFTGKIEYDVEDFDIDPIDLSSLPDFLSQSGTKLGLEDPRIYLSLNNPLGGYTNVNGSKNVDLQTGFTMTPERTFTENGVEQKETGAACGLDPNDNGIFKIPGGTTSAQNFVMSPANPSEEMAEYPNATHVAFTSLKNVLTETNGIPTKISVEAVSPKIPEQEIANFQLGTQLSAVEGSYMFYAPLQLTNNSIIMYTDTLDGWNDEDVDALTITKMVVRFNATTEVPFALDLSIQPTTLDGKPIKDSKGNSITSNQVYLPANANNQYVEVTINCSEENPVKHLDGLLIKAKVHDPDSQTSLAPDMKIHMKNSKAIVTGYYEKEL